ncbi:polysaccharide biosynthesis/export family protein [Stieleria sp. ICT_E10.1]|uniref:polysaccharide biosynthesis/export family protein n=1 Tax=Stieleria sedimenti TaxID=2976331 RepID=UPI00217FFD43|nr:polysaccharide biosynthesis/export family protein [Stieleria sedimenti]MCS7468066.1 polysaccharide biosynthesis/export family protein [Stieleria sedimenti]
MRYVVTVFSCFLIGGSFHAVADEDHLKLIQNAETLAAEYRSLENDSDAKSELKSKVKSLIQQSFEARQTAQRNQIQEMRKKLRRAEETLESREVIKDRIIDRKVEDLLSGQAADWKANAAPEDQLFDVIGIGDIVAVYLPGVLPFESAKQGPSPPKVTLLDSGRLVTGFPLAVGSDGAIAMPLVDPIEIAGLTVRAAEEKIAKTYLDADILRPGKARPLLTLIPKAEASRRTNEAPNTIAANALGNTSASPVAAGVASFEDTYGRLDKARELVTKFRSNQQMIDPYRQILESARVSVEERANARRAVSAYESIQATVRFRLELEKDYLTDVMEQLETELRSKQSLLEKATGKLAITEKLYTSGTTTSTELSDMKSQVLQAKVQAQSAELKYAQYKKIAKRWQEIVGDVLGEDADSK